MMHLKFSRGLSLLAPTRVTVLRSLAGLALVGFALAGATGCKKKEPKATDGETAATATADTQATGTPCEQLTKKLCGTAGEQSGTCSSAKVALELLSDAACSAALKDFATTEQKLKAQGSKCDELVEKLCAGVGKETDTCKMVTEKTKQFPPEQCVTMLGHIDEIIADLKKQEQANEPLNAELQAKVGAADAPSFGPADAKVTIVEFSDFECPYCSRAASVTNQVKEKYGDKVRLVFRQFPLSFHSNAQVAAEASLAAHAQGKFWEYHDKMFANQRALDRASLEEYAKALKLDMAKFKASLDSKEHSQRVQADLEMGGEAAVQGTPTMFINGKRIGNPTDFAAVSQEIESALGS